MYRFVRLFSLVFYIVNQKNKQDHFWTIFKPGPKGKIVQNGKIDKNPTGIVRGLFSSSEISFLATVLDNSVRYQAILPLLKSENCVP